MKLHSIKVSTSACTRAYATSRLYSTLVLYRKLSKLSRPAGKNKRRKHYTFRRQFNEKPSITSTGAAQTLGMQHSRSLPHACLPTGVEGVKQVDLLESSLVPADHA